MTNPKRCPRCGGVTDLIQAPLTVFDTVGFNAPCWYNDHDAFHDTPASGGDNTPADNDMALSKAVWTGNYTPASEPQEFDPPIPFETDGVIVRGVAVPHDLARQSFEDTKALKIAKELSIKHAAALQKLADGSSPIPTSVLRGIEQARRGEGKEIDVSDLDTSSEMLAGEDPENVTRWKMSVGQCVDGPCVTATTELDGEWVDYEDHCSCVTEAERLEAKRWLEVQLMGNRILIDAKSDEVESMRERAADVCKEAANNLFQQRKAELQPSLWDVLITASTAILSLKIESDE